jgi:hypothetical protein
MLLSESKYFPGHPSLSPGPFSPTTFGRKDIFNQRKQREFIPENKKDDSYWDRRRRNNEAAKRSREKRRLNDMLLETRVLELTKDNHILQAQLTAIYEKYGIRGENMISMDRVLATLPTNEQVLNFTKKRVGSTCSGSGGHGGMVSPSPSPISFQSLALPLMSNNNNNNNSSNSSSSSNNNNNNTVGTANNNHHHHHARQRSCSQSPSRSYRSPSPLLLAPRCYSPVVAAAAVAASSPYTDIRAYAETSHLYRRPLLSSSSTSSVPPRGYDDDQNDDKDSGLALNLSTDRGGSSSDGGRSSSSGSPPVIPPPGLLLMEREGSCSSGDESGYPRSPNSAGDSAGSSNSPNSGSNGGPNSLGSLLPHKLRFKSPPAVSEKDAVSSLLSLHQMAMIKREPVEHINHWMERMEAAAAAGNAGGSSSANFFASLLPRPESGMLQQQQQQQHRRDLCGVGEPLLKRARPENLTDEVARLTSEVATLKNILVNRMKDERSDEDED